MGNSRDVRNTKVNYQEKMSRVLIFIALLGTAAGFSTVPDSEWSALTGQWIQWLEDDMPAECLPGNSKNAPGTDGYNGAFTEVPLHCCEDRADKDLLIFNSFPTWTAENFPDEVCKDLSALFGDDPGTSYALAACDAEGTSWYGEDCTSGDIKTKCNCARMTASKTQPACFRAGDVPDDMVVGAVDADGNEIMTGKVRWMAYHKGCV